MIRELAQALTSRYAANSHKLNQMMSFALHRLPRSSAMAGPYLKKYTSYNFEILPAPAPRPRSSQADSAQAMPLTCQLATSLSTGVSQMYCRCWYFLGCGSVRTFRWLSRNVSLVCCLEECIDWCSACCNPVKCAFVCRSALDVFEVPQRKFSKWGLCVKFCRVAGVMFERNHEPW